MGKAGAMVKKRDLFLERMLVAITDEDGAGSTCPRCLRLQYGLICSATQNELFEADLRERCITREGTYTLCQHYPSKT